MSKIEMISYVPETGSYKVLFPKHFILEETNDNIETITSPNTLSNLTITGYQASRDVDEKILTEFFQEFTEDYISDTAIRKEITGKRICLEQGFKRNNINWIWWGVAEKNQIILISVNSEDKLSIEDYNFYRFIIDALEIYPSEYEE